MQSDLSEVTQVDMINFMSTDFMSPPLDLDLSILFLSIKMLTLERIWKFLSERCPGSAHPGALCN